MTTSRLVLLPALCAALMLTACGGDKAAGSAAGGRGGRAGAPPAMPVEIVTLEPKPVEQTSEFVGTVKSRRSTSIQPQVEGFITRIAVKSGDRVASGALLMEIDSRTLQASIAALESVRTQREIDLTYAKQESERAKRLLEAGAASQMEEDRATNAVKAAEAQLRTINEQVRQQQTELQYYRVTSSTSGVIGDVPVHEGDRVIKATVLTTIDSGEGLELYLNIPVQQAAQLRLGLPVRLLDDDGAVIATEPINFIAPSVDETTQSVLAKTAIGSSRGSARFRTSQYVRSKVVWSTLPGLTVPLNAVVRINGQFFAFVAESGQAGGAGRGEAGGEQAGLVARQRPVSVGPIVGNDYTVLGGLNAGDKLIVSGVQKIGDGAPVSPAPPAAPPQPASTASVGGEKK